MSSSEEEEYYDESGEQDASDESEPEVPAA